jgi:RNAse (barnase) inhibitor barstar
MAPFTRHPVEGQRLDWRLIQNGSIALYFRSSILEHDIGELKAEGYEIYEFHCESWISDQIMHKDLKHTLKLPDHYGSNLQALQDCLSDFKVPDTGGVALVLHRFDEFAKSAGAAIYGGAEHNVAEFVLDVLADTARYLMLTGSRFLTMVQSNDPQIRFKKLGCISAVWNPKEWADNNRRP